MIVEISADGGRTALGEVSPLPGVNREDMEQAYAETARLGSALIGQTVPNAPDLFAGALSRWLEPYCLSPSVRFGVETAVSGLVAGTRGVPMAQLIGDFPRPAVRVNALLAGPYEQVLADAGRFSAQGYTAFKLKVGGRPLAESVSLAGALRERLGPTVVLRLDANRGWDLAQAVVAFKQLAGLAIDYIEEPVRTAAELDALTSGGKMAVPVALDEGLVGVEPDQCRFPSNVGAVVLKPTVLGLDKAVRLARRAAGQGIKSVISSTFESGFGLKVLSHLAVSVNDDDVAAGLGTASWFGADLLPVPLRVESGWLPADRLPEGIGELTGVHPV